MKQPTPFRECKTAGLGIWQCPPFLFLVLGFITIISIIAAALVTSHYFEEPEMPTVIIVSFIAALFLIVGNSIIGGFHKLAEANRIKSQFVSIISHQLRTPISIFKWTLEALEDALKKSDIHSDTDAYMLSLLDANQRMIRLVNTLLDVTRIEARTVVLQEENFSLAEALKKIIDEFEHHAAAAHITLTIDSDINIPLVHADRQRIITVIETFIDNAIRYTMGSGAVTIRLKREGPFIRFSVSDTGVGIPKLQQKNMFQKFFRASNITQYQTEGTGIDLFISKYMIDISGGKIGFTSEEKKGSTFWFLLPIIA